MFLLKTDVMLLLCLITLQICGSEIHAQANSEPVIIEAPHQLTSSTGETNEFSQKISAHNITIVGDEFMLDGEPLHIISGSLHYFRVPAVYWRDRLRKLKAAGLNAVATYVEWSFHEPEERRYSFSGDRDVARFVRLAAEEGLHVLLRPGPYICAERDLGGLPYWLLGKYPNIKLRSTDKDFLSETETWMEKLFQQLAPLLFGNGGPIILVQVENEYGSYSNDMPYKLKMRDIISKQVGTNALLYTTDGTSPSMIRGGAIPGTLTTIDFGSESNVEGAFQTLRHFMSHGPLMNSEYYPGWLTHWGDSTSQHVPTERVVQTLRTMLANKINVNFYVFYGGTNFEFTAGANYDGYNGIYQPDITSYDYDAPLSEAGDPTAKYYAIREVLAQHNEKVKDIPLPMPSQKGNYGKVNVTKTLNLLSKEGRQYLGKEYSDVSGSQLPTFERLRQRSGFVLYEAVLNDTADGILNIKKPRDLVYVYVDNVFQGVISRIQKNYMLQLKAPLGSLLSLLVENQGRINYGSKLHDYKGILSEVKYNNKALNGEWSVKGYPLESVDVLSAQDQKCTKHGPVLYEGYFTLPEGQEPLDTFLDTTGWDKGYAWINGHNLGRYWPSQGPQVTLYVPGAWLRAAPAANRLQVLELMHAPPARAMALIDRPILDRAPRSQLYDGDDDCSNPCSISEL